MNQHLQKVLNSIQQSNHLSEEEKNALIKAVKDTDKEIAITEFKLDRTEKVKRTTAILLEETIAELEQKRKAVEEQNKELEIETALERVRAVAMSMNKPGDLLNICEVLFKELHSLGFTELRNSLINILNDETSSFANYDYSDEIGKSMTTVSYHAHSFIEKQLKQIKSANDAFSQTILTGNELKDWIEARRRNGEKDDPRLENAQFLYYYFYSIGKGAIGISTLVSIDENKLDLLKRFRNVFNLSYQRYMDIAQAEAQARESQIQLALERARAQSMIMQHSKELDDTLRVFHEQVLQLGIHSAFSFLWLPDEEKDRHIFWAAWAENNSTVFKSKAINYPLDRNEPATVQCLVDWKSKQPVISYHVPPEGIENYFSAWNELIAGVEELKPENFSDGVYYIEAFMKYGCFGVMVRNELHEEEKKILGRFAIEFERAYTRFLDLQKAEAQSREAQIEAALEKVRSRSLAMHKSDELKEVIRVVLEQFIHLKINAEHAGFYIDYKAQDDMHIWLADPNLEPFFAIIPYFDTPTWNSFLDAKAKGIPLHTDLLSFEEKNNFYQSLFKLFTIPEEAKQFYMQCKGLAVSTVLLDNVGLYIENFDAIPYSEDDNKILMRFGKVFQQTYTRFLDLQKAETQAREAQIEAALERVRSRSLAVHKSDEFNEVVKVVFENLKALDFEASSISINTFISNSNDTEVYICGNPNDNLYLIQYRLPYFDNLISNDRVNAQIQQTEFFSKTYNKQEKDDFYNKLLTASDLKLASDVVKNIISNSTLYTMSYAVNRHSMLVVNDFSGNILSQHQADILRRFANVFEQSYVRFLDLQKVEAQAREAKIEAALEKVRSRTMAMHKSDELLTTADLLFDQLKQLGAELQGVAFAICNNKNTMVQKWTSIGVFSHPYNIDPGEERMYEAWKNQSGYYEEVYEGEKQKRYYESFMEIPAFRQGVEKFIDSGHPIPSWQKNHAVTFQHGYLLFITTKPFNETQVFLRFGKVFEQTYTRFLDLQKAEAQAREAVVEASLERMRSVAMSIRKSEELILVAESLYKELKGLGITNIRNAQIVIKIEGDEMYLVCVYSDYTSEVFKESRYNTSPVTQQMYEELERSKEALYQRELAGKEFEQWLDWRRNNGAKIEEKLLEARSVSFCLYSIGEGHLGISAYNNITSEQLNVLKRFRNVFELSYRRFMDVAKSEEQAIKLQQEKDHLEKALMDLQSTQKQLIQSEKMASLGELTAGIAHEIQNPLNFVNNFSEVSTELVDEMNEEISKGNLDDAKGIAEDLKQNLEKINYHGKRAGEIVKGMLQHSRTSSGQKEPTDINALCDEYLRLAYHGLRAKDKSFNAEMKTDFDESIGNINIVPQDIGRVILNLISNAFYAVNEKKKSGVKNDEPLVSIQTKKVNDKIEISVKDNGSGIPKIIVDKIFQPFFTTKPTGQGTGLGLSLSYDIVKAHGGELKVETKEGGGSEFIIQLPIA